jgi:hypothetical protein
LSAEVEHALRVLKNENRPVQYPDIMSIISAGTSVGGLIVAAASFAWTVSNGRRKRDAKPSVDEIVGPVLEMMSENGQPTTPETIEITNIVVIEVLSIRDSSD